MTLDTLTIDRIFNQSSKCVRDIQTSCYNTFNLRPGLRHAWRTSHPCHRNITQYQVSLPTLFHKEGASG